jgi:DNA-binding response OmpR family regulator
MDAPPRILLVDDYADTAQAYARLLRRDGFDVSIATDCQTARVAAAQSEFDLLVCDLGLPDGDGCDLLRELRQRQHLAGIAVTGSGMGEDYRRSREAGFLFHLLKPIQIDALSAAIRSALAKRLDAPPPPPAGTDLTETPPAP